MGYGEKFHLSAESCNLRVLLFFLGDKVFNALCVGSPGL